MSEHRVGIGDEILDMLEAMGEDADLDCCDNLDEYEDFLDSVSTEELYDIYSSVNSQYERWLDKRRERANANST
jgi:hypothetical protein